VELYVAKGDAPEEDPEAVTEILYRAKEAWGSIMMVEEPGIVESLLLGRRACRCDGLRHRPCPVGAVLKAQDSHQFSIFFFDISNEQLTKQPDIESVHYSG
jgi:hypothetical protein